MVCMESSSSEKLAMFWVDYYGDVKRFDELLPAILETFKTDEGKLCDITHTWIYDFNETEETFIESLNEIRSDIKYFLTPKGKFSRRIG